MKSYIAIFDQYYLYSDAPCRENPNAIDRFFIQAKEHSTSEKGKFYFLNQMVRIVTFRHKNKGKYHKAYTKRSARVGNTNYKPRRPLSLNYDPSYFTLTLNHQNIMNKQTKQGSDGHILCPYSNKI